MELYLLAARPHKVCMWLWASVFLIKGTLQGFEVVDITMSSFDEELR